MKSKKEVFALIKANNPKFFDRETMRFFGKQKFTVIESFGRYHLKIKFFEKCPRETVYVVNNATWKISHPVEVK